MIMPSLVQSLRREADRRLRGALARSLVRLPVVASLADEAAWLLGGSVGAHYGDNSAALHRYVRTQHPDVAATWVINRESPDVARAQAVGPVVFADDMATMVRAQCADVVVISHSIQDVPGADRAKRPLKVRLGHGLTALKKTKPPPLRSLRTVVEQFGLVAVSSEFEKHNKMSWGIPPDRIEVTGVPRFDDLLRRARLVPPSNPSTILYMPTWRDWLPREPRAAAASRFFQEVTGLLNDERLARLLERNDLFLEVYVHRLLHRHIALFSREMKNQRVVLLSTTADVQEHLARARFLVTDYSGVTWDMLYLDRPVVFFPFDVDDYERHRGAYLDLRKDLPGKSAPTRDHLIRALEETVAEGMALPTVASRWQARAFAFRDDGNCARVMAAIQHHRGRRR
jgi:CDP-glycerol glycerophosphotransferase (TagB/SpsB family)